MATGEMLAGRYRLDERVGVGGMAEVFRARDTVLQRTVAIKVLRGSVDGLATLERARTETTLLAGLNHHALVTLHDAHISADEPSYLVMEFVDGRTLRELMDDGPVDPADAATILREVAEALHVAHTAGVVHRDIKPANILLTASPLPHEHWRPKVADFGIAYLLDSTRVTTPGMSVGTAAYVAPEQAQGHAPSPPADVYALGIVMIEALSGTRPFADLEGIGGVVARISRTPDIPESIAPQWRGLLERMTALDPGARPTALEIAVAAAGLAASAEGTARPGVPAGADATTAPTRTVATATSATTGATAILPTVPPLPPPPGVAATAPAASRRRRRGLLWGGLAAGALLLAIAVGGAVWLGGAGAPAPMPSEPVGEQSAPAETPSPTPAPVVDDGGSDNSGPGNNNGNGNSGNGGNGNGNGGQGNGRGNGNG